ncbi:MAG: TetR/AcrR family transcriptional regulator [Spirochaetales bacterium]|nr:TetR/AcrR family transcriptional regulator [Spirochaetales bacterium]
MPKIIDHEKRKQDILKRAFVIFAQKGYQDTNLSYIADRCGISRPTLYLYFKDKEEIFYYAVKQMTEGMFMDYKGMLGDSEQNELDKLKFICRDIIEKSFRKRDFYSSLADFLFQMKRQGKDYSREIDKRTVGLIYLFSIIIRKGIKKGEIRNVPAKETAYQLFSLIEAFAFQIAMIEKFEPSGAVSVTISYLESLSTGFDQ